MEILIQLTMLKGRRISFLAIFLMAMNFMPTATICAQEKDSAKLIIVEKAETFFYRSINNQEYQWMVGNVRMRQGNVYMKCDSALLQDNSVKAYGRVLIQQTDTISLFSDSLWYNGNTRIADLFSKVTLINGRQQLFTDKLNYDLNQKIGTYTTGAVLTDGKTKLSSRKGYYYVNEKKAYFKTNVRVYDPDFDLKSDTLLFDSEKKIAYFFSPTIIAQDTARIYCEDGFYDIGNKKAEFRKNAQYESKTSKASGDTIRYVSRDESIELIGKAYFERSNELAKADRIKYTGKTKKTDLVGNAYYKKDQQTLQGPEIKYDGNDGSFSTKGRSRISDPPQIIEANNIDYSKTLGLGLATGDVTWQDTIQRIILQSDTAAFNRSNDYVRAYGKRRPLLINYEGTDSLFMTADTLISYRDTLSSDSTRYFKGYHDVRILRKDLQVVCDSLTYNSKDSVMTFYNLPIMWSDTSQFVADTIKALLNKGQLERILLRSNSLIINQQDSLYFNQIKGRDITAFMKERKIELMDVQGNAESVYYVLDDQQAYIGVNKSESANIAIRFEEGKIKTIHYLNQPHAKFMPMGQVNHEKIKLQGFKWETKRRPIKLSDLF